MDRADGRLSDIAHAHWPGAVVWATATGWELRRPGVPAVALGEPGDRYPRAARALRALIRAAREEESR